MKTAVAIATVALPPTLAPSDPNYRRERYSVDQAAVYLEVNRSRIYSLCALGVLAHRVDGGRKRFSQADLDAWRDACRIEVARPAPARPRLATADGAQVVMLPAIKHRRFSE